MPIIDLGYRAWAEERSPRILRPIAVTATSLRMIWRTVWYRRLLIFALLPILPIGLGFFLYEQNRFQGGIIDFADEILMAQSAGVGGEWVADAMDDSAEARHRVWAALLLGFFRYPQAVLMVVLFGLVAPRLISYDLRSRAYLLYFSRPLTVAEYLIGKSLVLIVLLAFTCTIPALCAYLVGLSFSPDAWTFLDTWDLPLRILLASVALAIPTSALAIFFSSFTSESRYASFAWFATWGLGWVTYLVLTSNELLQSGTFLVPKYLNLLSLYHALGVIQSLIFGTLPNPADATASILLICVLTFCGILVSYVRIANQLRM